MSLLFFCFRGLNQMEVDFLSLACVRLLYPKVDAFRQIILEQDKPRSIGCWNGVMNLTGSTDSDLRHELEWIFRQNEKAACKSIDFSKNESDKHLARNAARHATGYATPATREGDFCSCTFCSGTLSPSCQSYDPNLRGNKIQFDGVWYFKAEVCLIVLGDSRTVLRFTTGRLERGTGGI